VIGLLAAFPPDSDAGLYTGHLPHVLLSHASLPWHKLMESGSRWAMCPCRTPFASAAKPSRGIAAHSCPIKAT
jgi:hypothetical protein